MVSSSLVCGCNRLISQARGTGKVNATAAVLNKHFSVLSTSLSLNKENNQQRHCAGAFFLSNASRSNKPLTINIANDRTVRSFGRKAGKMGQHLKTLDEMAHRDEHLKAKEKRKKKKGGKMKADDSATSFASNNYLEEIPALEEDELETKFDNGDADDEEDLPSLPSSDDVKSRMMKVVSAMEESFRSIRGAEPSPELFDAVQVKAYGTFTPLNSVAQVVITSPTLATLTCFDPETAPAVRDAVRDMAGMNFNPRIEDNSVIVPIPRVSAETRKALVKQLSKVAESTRQRVRRIRRGAQDVVKKGKDGNLGPGISKDDAFRVGKEIDAVTEDCINALNDVFERKQADVMAV